MPIILKYWKMISVEMEKLGINSKKTDIHYSIVGINLIIDNDSSIVLLSIFFIMYAFLLEFGKLGQDVLFKIQ